MTPRQGTTVWLPHVPKCGGTTVRRAIEAAGLNAFYDDDHPPSHTAWGRSQCARRNREFAQLDFSPFDIVYGHYPAGRYRHGGALVTVLRDPVERAISHFNYYKHLVPPTNTVLLAQNPAIGAVKEGRMDIVAFARDQRLDGFLRSYLGELGPDDFLRVFFTDDLPALFDWLTAWFGRPVGSSARERHNPAKDVPTAAEREALSLLLAEETALYRRFVARWG